MSIYKIEIVLCSMIEISIRCLHEKSYTKGEISYKLRKVATMFFF